MKTYVIEPRDPVMFRDARPFGAGSDKTYSLEFAWPSTLAGFVRSRAGRDASGRFTLSAADARRLAVRGPWLVELNEDAPATAYLPAPRDLVWFRGATADQPWTRRRLAPSAWREGELSDLQTEGLAPIAFEQELADNPGKPASGPAFWTWEAMLAWLRAPAAAQPMTTDQRAALGIESLPHERRTHVKIQAETKTAEDGMLFSTDALRFALRGPDGIRRFGLACQADVGPLAPRMKEGLSTLGGERRPVYVHEMQGEIMPRPTWTEADVVDGGCRVVLATPGIFEAGWRPTLAGAGQGPTLHAACVGRPGSLSGWDLDKRQPKPSRRVVPAGSVYWLRWPEGTTAGRIAEWMNEHWMESLCEDEQDRRDGFGMILTGRG